MNINLENLNKLVISHGHNDHTGGLEYFIKTIQNKNIELIAHPNCFYKKYFEKEYIGGTCNKRNIRRKF